MNLNMPTPGFTLGRSFCSSSLDIQCVLNFKIPSERPLLMGRKNKLIASKFMFHGF